MPMPMKPEEERVVNFTIGLYPTQLAALDRAAKDDFLTRNAKARQIIMERLVADGYLNSKKEARNA